MRDLETTIHEVYTDLFIDFLSTITDIQNWQKQTMRAMLKAERPLILCRPRCRWRPRESRRMLEGLSAGSVVIDEYAFAEDRG